MIVWSKTNVVWKNVARTDFAWTDFAWTNVARRHVAWTNGTGPLVSSQGWLHCTNLKCPPRYFPGGVGGGEVEINAISAQHSWNWA